MYVYIKYVYIYIQNMYEYIYIHTIFFASHKPQLQLSVESNFWLSASQNETELVNLAAHDFVSESRNRTKKSSYQTREEKQKGAKGV